MKLTSTERWILANQYLILQALYPDDKQHFQEAFEALENGYEGIYSRFSPVQNSDTDPPLSAEDCKEVTAIMNMFRVVKHHFDNLKKAGADVNGVDEHYVTFLGFDGNEETSLMSYAMYYCRMGSGNFDEFNPDDFNSHAEMLPKYRRMYTAWKASPELNELTKADLIRITNA